MTPPQPRHCGHAALVGRPNAGKSTLLNRILGNKIAITSSKPQTTRDRIVGIHTDDRMQVVLIDTPGLHEAWTELNKTMVRRTRDALAGVDVICWLEDMTLAVARARAGRPVLDEAADGIATLLQSTGRPVILVANKVDVVEHAWLLPVIDAWRQRLPLAAVVPVSALTGDGVGDLLAELHQLLPEAPLLHPEDAWTEVSERFLAAEIVREKIFHLTAAEIPYSAAVEIESFDETARETEELVRIRATITVERPQQKGIVIGKGGDMLKRIGTLARKDLQRLLGCRVYLELFVKVEPDWTRSARGVRKLGYE